MDDSPAATTPRDEYIAFLHSAEEKLQQTSLTASSHAFNLAISVGLIPAGLLLLVIFLVVRGSLPSLLISVILIVIGLVIFASLVVNTSRERSLLRVYQQEILPQMHAQQEQSQLPKEDYYLLAQEQLGESSIMLKFILNAGPEQPT